MKKNQNYKLFIINILVMVVTFLLVLLFFELIFRFNENNDMEFIIDLNYINRTQRINETIKCNEDVTYLRTEKYVIRKPNLTCGFHAPNFSTNSYGFRDIEYPIKKNQNTKRVMIIGDSVTEGFGLYEYERYSELLEFKLNNLKNSSINYEVWNLGVGGTSFENYLNILKYNYINYSPDIVIIGFTENDYSMDYGFDRFQTHYQIDQKIPIVIPLGQGINKILIKKSLFYRFINVKLYNIIVNYNYYKKRKVYFENDIQKDIKLLKEFSKLSEQNNFPIVIVFFPYLNDKYKEIEWLRKVKYDKFNISSVDLLPNFKETVDSLYELSIEHYYWESSDYIHLGPYANQMAAEIIFEHLVSLNFTE
jgi:lysophospholipase L1-like esterase